MSVGWGLVKGVQTGLEKLLEALQRFGMQLPKVVSLEPLIVTPKGEVIETVLDRACCCATKFFGHPPDFVFIILPDTGTLYDKVKQQLDSSFGVLSQCLQHKNLLQAGFEQYARNVALKLNAKLGGINHGLADNAYGKTWTLSRATREPFLVIGAHVAHSREYNRPSIAAVCCSTNHGLTKYSASVKMQSPGLDIISDLQSMVGKVLEAFEGPKPEEGRPCTVRVLFFRDSKGQDHIKRIRSLEVPLLRAAILDAWPKAQSIKIACIAVSKAHHTNFFAMKGKVSVNAKAGTIVDGNVVHPCAIDFFLKSHIAQPGTTSSPAYYVIVHDDLDLHVSSNIADFKRLCHGLCHLFCRSTRANSVVAPLAYAHLAAAHAERWLGKVTVVEEDDRPLLVEWAPLHKRLEHKMYFL
eukprot:jgi/Botrbrau1/17959/Bobra.50_1s0051.1